jgi:carotenoid 1,2-hydratase
MLGNVFSPYYAAARAKGPADPLEFSALNVAVYGPRRDAWVLTERTRTAVQRSREELELGPSRVRWRGDALEIAFDERTSPFGRPLRGRVRVTPEVVHGVCVRLDGARGRHAWWPIAPRSRVEVELDEPSLRFSGTGYLDANAGREALEDAFSSWSWSRAHGASRTRIAYAVERRDGSSEVFERAFDARGLTPDAPLLVRRELPRTGWFLARPTHAEPGASPTVARTLEDTPFYARTEIADALDGEPGRAVHEVLSLDRFVTPWVRFMLPYRMRREAAR